MKTTAPQLAIILPVLNEAQTIERTLLQLRQLRDARLEIIIVDGGSSDNTVELAVKLADRVIEAPRGRGSQMNAGARLTTASGFLFLHADTEFSQTALTALLSALDGKEEMMCWGRFDIAIDGKSHWLKMVAWMMNWRSRLSGIATGDQAIFMTRTMFDAVGAYADIPLMEDIEISRRLRRLAPPCCLDARVLTSGRRWEQHGVWHTIFSMWSLRLRYWLGEDPHRLALKYGYVPREPQA